jgi:hypothetical protein
VNGPTPPVNVRAVLHDGREVAVELAYVGRERDGTHAWESTEIFPIPRAVLADMVPAHTSVVIRTGE